MRIIIIIVSLVSVVPFSFTENTCRLSNGTGIFLPPHEFATQSCINCYRFNQDPKKILPAQIFQNVTYPVMMDDPDILSSFETDKGRQSWQMCCRKAVDCCDEQQQSGSGIRLNSTCPATWDGWQCWSHENANTIRRKSCPTYIFSCPREAALKTCDSNGQWFRLTATDEEWTDYTECSGLIQETRAVYVSIAAYAISLFTVTPALLIFHTFSILQCFRIELHRNLFLSLQLHSVAKITFEARILLPEIYGANIMDQNGVFCRILTLATMFFTISNYMWMMCEGLLLQRQLVNAFAEESRQWMFFAIGWGIPTISTLIILIYRLSGEDEKCWALHSSSDWVFYTPCILSLIINLGFFVYILIVVVRTLSRQITDNVIQFRKAVRAGLVLVPLFGLHFFLTIYRPNEPCTVAEEYYIYATRVLEGLQGGVVAVIYCYINSDVRSALCRTYRNLSEKRQLVHGQSTYTSAIFTQTSI